MNNKFKEISIEINKIEEDEFHRTSAVLAINKEKWMTSHDVVNIVRKKLHTRKVGHAGALDPFATGVLIILVGGYTKLSNDFLESDKEYRCRILLGISSTTQDIEGSILEIKNADFLKENMKETVMNDLVNKALKEFGNGYDQRVPVFSSVKVDGKKFRVLARKYASHKVDKDGIVKFCNLEGDEKFNLKLPKRHIEIKKLELLEIKTIIADDLPVDFSIKIQNKLKKSGNKFDKFVSIELVIGCSKGTYIRQFAEDLGEKLKLPAMLLELERTKSGNISISDCMQVEEIPEIILPSF